LVRSASPRLLAQALVARAAAHLYDGRFTETATDLQQAQAMLATMDDTVGRLRLFLLWGDYGAGMKDWEAALQWLDKAREQWASLAKVGGTAVIESVQLRLGLAQIALHTKQSSQAASLLAVAQAEVNDHALVWWRPAVAFWQGILHQKLGNKMAAEQKFQEGITAVTEGGNPDELPLILLRLGQIIPEDDLRHWHYLETAVSAAYDRARQPDKLICLQEAGACLAQAPDPRLRRIGAGCLAALPL
jgi:tetratricopeptide (TPR) repeat protein